MRALLVTLLLCFPVYADGKSATVPVAVEGVGIAGSGTGVCIASAGGKSLVITNRHVLKDVTKCWAIVDGKLVKGTVVFVNDGPDDLAAMEIEATVDVAVLATADPAIGDSVTHYGRMSGPQKGKVQGLLGFTTGAGVQVIELLSDTVSIPGDSGAGVFSATDQLVSLNTGRIGPIDTGMQMGVPVTHIRAVLADKLPKNWVIK